MRLVVTKVGFEIFTYSYLALVNKCILRLLKNWMPLCSFLVIRENERRSDTVLNKSKKCNISLLNFGTGRLGDLERLHQNE